MRIIASANYSQTLNCSAPKSIRIPGAVYRLRNPEVKTQTTGNSMFYKLSNNVSLYEPVEIGPDLKVSAAKTWLT